MSMPETPRDGGADLCRVELFAFDFAALEDVSGECLQNGFLLKIEA